MYLGLIFLLQINHSLEPLANWPLLHPCLFYNNYPFIKKFLSSYYLSYKYFLNLHLKRNVKTCN